MIARHKTRVVAVGQVCLGGDSPIAVQSMNNTDTRDVEATLVQIRQLAEAGCEITRVAIPDLEAAEALARICRQSPIPVVADIHFDYRLALAAIKSGADKIRINPGNIGGADRMAQIADAARERGIAIRIGVNSGSLSQVLIDRHGGVNAASMAESALEAISQLEKMHFYSLVLSVKSSDPLLTIECYRRLAQETDYPLHVGVTEAGTPRQGLIRSAVGIGTLLAEGIGDTLRVSLTADPVEEVHAAWSILQSLDIRLRGPRLISCPTCGRTAVNLQKIAEEVERRLQPIRNPIRVAVMGCVVNGPGEACHADIGLAGGRGEFIIFRKGKATRKVREEEAVDELMREIALMIQEDESEAARSGN